MKRKEMMWEYLLRKINDREWQIDYIRSRRYVRLDEVDLLELIILLTEYRVYVEVAEDFRAIFKITEGGDYESEIIIQNEYFV